MLSLIWVQTDRKGYQQNKKLPLAQNELKFYLDSVSMVHNVFENWPKVLRIS